MPSAIATAISEPTNAGKSAIETEKPYTVFATILGTSDILLHAWNCDAVEARGSAKKGSAAKKTDNLDSYVMRNDDGVICLPSEYLRMAIVNAAKFHSDPRSPRKSAMDLMKAALVGLEPLCPIKNFAGQLPKTWDFEHKCRVQVQRNGITRTRPAFKKGWQVSIPLMCNLAAYVPPTFLHELVSQAGKVIGVGDFRPTYGRFQIIKWEVSSELPS